MKKIKHVKVKLKKKTGSDRYKEDQLKEIRDFFRLFIMLDLKDYQIEFFYKFVKEAFMNYGKIVNESEFDDFICKLKLMNMSRRSELSGWMLDVRSREMNQIIDKFGGLK